MKLSALTTGFLAAGATASDKVYGMYYEQWHNENLPNSTVTNGITHVYLSFINPSELMASPIGNYTPFVSVESVKQKFGRETKVLISVGGWGWTAPFADAAANDTTRNLFAENCATMLNKTGADGVDIDWEYPGGNGDNYKQIPNSVKTTEIILYPLLLTAIRGAIGKDKLLTIAVPGRRVDMIAFNEYTIPAIADQVDFFNIMTYDLMNRRENITKHHSGVANSLDTINTYLSLGLQPNKAVLGFAFYAKWFTTDPESNCSVQPIGCATVATEDALGADNGKSGTVTFEPANMAPPTDPSKLTLSPDGSCGPSVGHKCATGFCCSQFGFCGSDDTFCGSKCLAGYGSCNGASIVSQWQTALKNGIADEVDGGQYYWDGSTNVFWTWDTPHFIEKKFDQIVEAKKLRGAMAYSLGSDTYGSSNILAIQKEMQ